MSQKHFSTNCFKFKESLQIRIQKPCSNWIQYVPKKWQLHLIKQLKNVHLPLNKFCLVSVFGMLCLFCGCIIRIEKIVCFSHVMMMNCMSNQLSFWLFHLRTDSEVHRTRFKCRCIYLDIFFLCWCACLLHFSLNGLCLFFRFLFCENPFDAIVFDFMSRIFQRFFSGVLIYFVSKNVVLKCKSKHETENILKTTTLTQQNKKRYKNSLSK